VGLVGVFVVASAAAASPVGRITVAREATVREQVIRLGDVAALEGEDVRPLASIVLGPAPAAGESRGLDGALILGAIRREAGALDGITYTIPATVRVRRAAQQVGEAAVRQILEGFLAETLGPGAADTVLRSVELPGPILLPDGPYSARVIPAPGTALLGRVRLQLEFTAEDRPVKRVWITADIGVYGPTVLAARPVARGEVLREADLIVDRQDLSQAPRGVVTELAAAVGMVARTPLLPHAPIRREQIESPAAVHRGDVVLLVAERGALRITAPGEVREDAGVGQQVRVVNRGSRKDLVGRVLDASTVAVDF
jgi:flagella basal body P-ring formation protein FlgA